MNKKTQSKGNTYQYIVDVFGKERVDSRFTNLKKKILHFIEKTGCSDIYILNDALLKDAITDYFADIQRLKDFQEIQHTNKNKITAYTAYWILRRKPIQIVIDDCRYEFLYPNEQFITSLILKDLFPNCDLIKNSNQFESLSSHIMYHLRFRPLDASNLELFIEGVRTGFETGVFYNSAQEAATE